MGFDQYAKLYADTETWLASGWIDYWSPQLYWKVDAPGQPFRPLLNYWIEGNKAGRHVWPGLSVSRVGAEPGKGYEPQEIFNQIRIIREAPGDDGVVLFSMKPLLQDRRGVATSLAEGLFREPALVPASPWLGADAPAAPRPSGAAGKLTIEPGPEGAPPALWVVQARDGDAWTTRIVPASQPPSIDLQAETFVAGVSRTGVAGPPLHLRPAGPDSPAP